MKKDIDWLKEEIKIEIVNLFWKGELDACRTEALIHRLYYLVECYDESQNKEVNDQGHNYTDTSKYYYDRAQTTKTQFVGDSLRDVLRASTVCRKEESNKELDWLKKEIDFLHDSYKKARQNTNEDWTSYRAWLDGGILVFREIDYLFDQVETMQRSELPVVPNYVAEFVEYHKRLGGTIHQATNLNSFTVQYHFPRVYENNSRELQELIARAWLEGYTVDDE